jgi:hypothetical protein
MQAPPFFVKLVKPGTSFSDFHTKFHISGDQVKELKTLTPLIKQWLMNGGLTICDEDGEVAEAGFRPPTKSGTRSLGLGKGPSQPAKTVSKSAKGAIAEAGDTPADDGHEKTLDELMNEK